ncbi:MAG: CNP1-like family protein [Rhodoferax sp.]|nr:CNP1-like family protein [Rhodoferax sp.]
MTKLTLWRVSLSLVLGLSLHGAQAQADLDLADWTEEDAPPPPAFSWEGSVELQMPPYVTVKVAIDPRTINIGKDSVVRYVAIMRNSSGTVNAFYEGLRCTTDEVKTYARAGSSGSWSLVSKPEWKDVNGTLPSKHAFIFARQAACNVRVVNRLEEIQQFLKTPRPMGKEKHYN